MVLPLPLQSCSVTQYMGPCLTVFCITIVGSAENCYTMQESTGIEEIARLGTPPQKKNLRVLRVRLLKLYILYNLKYTIYSVPIVLSMQ